MPFRVCNSVLNNTSLVHLSDNNHSTTVTIIPELAMLHEFIILADGRPFNIIENYSLDRPPREQVTHYFRSAKLSPWVCRLANGRYKFNGNVYQVERMYNDGTALHGLLFDQPFTVSRQFAGNDGAYVILRHDYTGYDSGFPYTYQCEVTYTLKRDGELMIQTVVTNTGAGSFPLADGWHPYFQLGGKADDWELYFNASAMVEFDERLIPTGRLLPYRRFNPAEPIGNTKMDNCFALDKEGPENGGPQFACTVKNPANGVSVSFLPSRSYPYLQIFIPDHRESIAIENISSAPDSFNNNMGLRVLGPGQTASFEVSVKAGVELPDL
ncbi:MAG TPA: aldose 1-epimerase [Chitinophagaceae bacterium]|nr:aldose 1-epimerase [Chitinophagaceae bacterium]